MEHLNKKISYQIGELSSHNEPYKSCHELSRYIQNLIVDNEVEEFQRSIDSVLEIYQNDTDYATKNAIENVLLYRLSTDIMLCKNRKKIFSLLPVPFRKIIAGQIACSGI